MLVSLYEIWPENEFISGRHPHLTRWFSRVEPNFQTMFQLLWGGGFIQTNFIFFFYLPLKFVFTLCYKGLFLFGNFYHFNSLEGASLKLLMCTLVVLSCLSRCHIFIYQWKKIKLEMFLLFSMLSSTTYIYICYFSGSGFSPTQKYIMEGVRIYFYVSSNFPSVIKF